MRLPTETLLYALAFCLGRSVLVWANTEIVNFGVEPSLDVAIPQSAAWRRITPSSSEQLFHVFPAPLETALADVCEPVEDSSFGECPHELWLSLGTDEDSWAAYTKFTLRISWPASSPADFYIDTYSPESLGRFAYGRDSSQLREASHAPLTRRAYARIRVVSTGVLTPSHAHRFSTPDPVLFMVAVEPLHFGVLPGSVVPTIFAIVAVAAVAGAFVVPFVTKHLIPVADDVKEEIAGQQVRKMQ
ncbi:hypothetical protein GSI_05927 [Ganoderma sinense ZZ0214-1]|uniref:Protein PBN1 n=1 Tax=Ganoderma sinense ZZ0214-1 TaxID=1077348 RepID=A0A2G8SBU5_9APHY|nr:hypothetical protein GSI_05927 [Ganoderma sinense ZZ0214-1]